MALTHRSAAGLEAEPVRSALDRLFLRIADGDRAAIGPAFRILWPVVREVCGHMLRSVADADDATQAALEKVFERIAHWDPQRPAHRWAVEIALWECRTIRRRAQRSQQRLTSARARILEVLELTMAEALPSPEDIAEARDLRAALLTAVRGLSAADQEVILAILEDHDMTDAITRAAGRKRRQRALERLRALWGRSGGARPMPDLKYA